MVFSVEGKHSYYSVILSKSEICFVTFVVHILSNITNFDAYLLFCGRTQFTQRFYEHGGESQVAVDAPLQPSMDIFSLGYASHSCLSFFCHFFKSKFWFIFHLVTYE